MFRLLQTQFRFYFLSFPSTLPFFIYLFTWWLLLETVPWHHLYHVHSHIYSLLFDKCLCENQKVLVKFLCALLVYFFLSSGDLFIFSFRVSRFYSYFCVIRSSIFLFQVIFLIIISYLDRIIGLVVSMSDYRSWGRGFDPRHFHKFSMWIRSGTGSTQPREDKWVPTWLRTSGSD